MDVKCPKCRFKFGLEVSPGIKELACVCPRCGTPFTYTLTEENEIQTSDTEVSDNGIKNEAVVSSKTDVYTKNPYVLGEQTASDECRMMPIQNTINGAKSPIDNGAYHVSRNHRSCIGGCLIIFLFLLLVSVFEIRSCNESKSYSSDELRSDGNETINTTADSEGMPDTASVDKDDFTEIHPTKAPRWIQGEWTVKTEYGSIIVKIKGDNIYEIAGGESTHGKFFYENSRLTCDYGDGSIIVYKLDDERHLIDVGDGMFMHKVK